MLEFTLSSRIQHYHVPNPFIHLQSPRSPSFPLLLSTQQEEPLWGVEPRIEPKPTHSTTQATLHPTELRCTLLIQATPTELRRTLLRYYALFRAALHPTSCTAPAELHTVCCTLWSTLYCTHYTLSLYITIHTLSYAAH
jgi:hypothetical protein